MIIIILFIIPFIMFVLIATNNTDGIFDYIKKDSNALSLKVYEHTTGKILTMSLEDYTLNAVAAEMPADFEIEALKAQAICSRTFAYSRKLKLQDTSDKHFGCDVCTNFAHCQAFITKENFLTKAGKSGDKLWEKLQKAVTDTRGILITYNKTPINPLFHANSGGSTENIEDVWDGDEVPYLKSVVSLGEDLDSNYLDKKIFEPSDFLTKLKITKKFSPKEILAMIKYNRSSTGRVKNILVCGNSFKGTDFRQLLDLHSTNFLVGESNSQIIISTSGYGHGVGMSQRGANYLALNGGNYKEIIKHYYKDVEITPLSGIK